MTLTRYPGMIHGFVSMAALVPQGLEALKQIAAFLRKLYTAPLMPAPGSRPLADARGSESAAEPRP